MAIGQIQAPASFFSGLWAFTDRHSSITKRVIKVGLQVFGLAALGYGVSGTKTALFSTGLGLICHSHFPHTTDRIVRSFAAGNMLFGGGLAQIVPDKNTVHKTLFALAGATIATCGTVGGLCTAAAFARELQPDPNHLNPWRSVASIVGMFSAIGSAMIGTALSCRALQIDSNTIMPHAMIVGSIAMPVSVLAHSDPVSRWQNLASRIASIAVPFSLGTFSALIGGQTLGLNLAIVLGDAI